MRARTPRALVLCVALAALACAPPAQRRYERRLEAAPPAARHGVYSDRLVELMQSLDRLQHERLPQAMDAREERARRMDEVVRLALEMANSAAQISDSAAEAALEPSARAEFDGYAAQLASRARALAGAAETISPPEMRARTEGVVEVCDACHARFRIPREHPGT